ncbi:Hydrophobin [Arthrobotrys entomopaga]|nr:Hydrophobin [Arthrobotrys entomopaga]
MQFTKIFALFALTGAGLAVPAGLGGVGALVPSFPAPQGVTVNQAATTCGQDMSLSCCNDVDLSQDASSQAAGLLGLQLKDVLGNVGLFGKCNDISIPVLNIIPVNNLLNNKCKQNVACCQNSGTTQNGLLNVGLPCVALSSLI